MAVVNEFSEATGVSVVLARPHGSLLVLPLIVDALSSKGEASRQPSGMENKGERSADLVARAQDVECGAH